MKWQNFTVFTIKNINKFLYKVEISGNVFELQTPVPTELQTLFRLSPSQLQQSTSNNTPQQVQAQTLDVQKNIDAAFDAVPENHGSNDDFEQALAELQSAYKNYAISLNDISASLINLKQTRNQLIIIAQKGFTAIRYI